MAIFEDVLKGGNMTGVVIGVGAAILAPAIVPMLRPMAKAVIKASLITYEQGRVLVGDLSETAGEVVAEARKDIEEAKQAVAAEEG